MTRGADEVRDAGNDDTVAAGALHPPLPRAGTAPRAAPAPPGPPAPPSVRLFPTAADSSTASIEWDAVAGTANYKVYRRAEDESSWTFIATTSATSTTVAIPTAGTYMIRVNIVLLNGTEVEANKGVWVTR